MTGIKLKSFTVIELVVALLLMTIVMAIAYSALSLTTKQLLGLQRRFGMDNEYRLLQNALQRDMGYAHRVRWMDGSMRCESAQGMIDYLFLDTMIVRQPQYLTADSFLFEMDSVFIGLEKLPQLLEGGMIDEIRLELRRDQRSYTLYQQKIYDAATLMEQQ